jgi:hypothetical protein
VVQCFSYLLKRNGQRAGDVGHRAVADVVVAESAIEKMIGEDGIEYLVLRCTAREAAVRTCMPSIAGVPQARCGDESAPAAPWIANG